jgi:hypothetical protein
MGNIISWDTVGYRYCMLYIEFLRWSIDQWMWGYDGIQWGLTKYQNIKDNMGISK